MFFTPNFSLFYFYWFFQLYFFLCSIFNISLRPKHMCPGSCSLKNTIRIISSVQREESTKQRGYEHPWFTYAFHTLFKYPDYGISFPNDLKSIFRVRGDFTRSSSCGIHIFQTVFVSLDPRGWQGAAPRRGLGRQGMRFMVITVYVWSPYWCRTEPREETEDAMAKSLMSLSLHTAVFKGWTKFNSQLLNINAYVCRLSYILLF